MSSTSPDKSLARRMYPVPAPLGVGTPGTPVLNGLEQEQQPEMAYLGAYPTGTPSGTYLACPVRTRYEVRNDQA